MNLPNINLSQQVDSNNETILQNKLQAIDTLLISSNFQEAFKACEELINKKERRRKDRFLI